MNLKKTILDILESNTNRYLFWSELYNSLGIKSICEVGVYKGDFAEHILKAVPSIETYVMIDPWKNLNDWNKPANVSNEIFESYYQETLTKTDFVKEKIQILRGRTKDVHKNLRDESLDAVYIDGDHTLRGISIDLITMWDKVKNEGFISGDDFCPSIWQHEENFEPTLVFPFALYYAEAKNTKIFALPFNQFLITKKQDGFEFIDLTNGGYNHKNLRDLIVQKPYKNVTSVNFNIVSLLKNKLKEK